MYIKLLVQKIVIIVEKLKGKWILHQFANGSKVEPAIVPKPTHSEKKALLLETRALWL